MANTFRFKGNLKVEPPGGGFAWLDTGTHHSLLDAGASGKNYKKVMPIS